jgi:hypothetical protein
MWKWMSMISGHFLKKGRSDAFSSITRVFMVGAILALPGPVRAQKLPSPDPAQYAKPEVTDTLVRDLPDPQLLPAQAPSAAAPADAAAESSAVKDISNEPGWIQDLMSKKWPVSFGVVVTETYDDNIFISPQKSGDFVTQIGPAVLFSMGDKTAPDNDYLRISASPTGLIYADHPEQDTVDFDGDLIYQHSWTRLTVGVEQRYQKLSTATIDVGDLVRRDIYTTLLTAAYTYNDDLTLYGTGTQRISDYNASVPNTNEWIGDFYGLYQVTPKLAVGFGPRIGAVDIVGAPNQSYEEALVHLNYNLTGKILLTLTGGGEYLSYQDNTPSRLLPVFEFSAGYQPFDGTNVSLSAYRENIPSYDELGENYVSTVVQGNVKQRFLRNYYFIGSGGYDMADYQFASQGDSGPRRDDRYFFVQGGVEWDPNDWMKVSAQYEYSQDQSSFSENSFTDNQFNLQTSAAF